MRLRKRSDKTSGSLHDLAERQKLPMTQRLAPGNDPIPSKEELLQLHPEWEGDKTTALESGKPWLDHALNLRDPKTGWILPGTPRRFNAGRSGNPNGTARKPSVTRELTRLLRYNKNLQIALAVKLVSQALSDDPRALDALKVALDRLDGPVRQEVDFTARQVNESIVLVDRSANAPLPLEQPKTTNGATPRD